MFNVLNKIRKYPYSKPIFAIGLCSLGFYRGVNAYSYRYKKINKYEESPVYLYTSAYLYGFYGSIIYITPFLWPIILPKEIYRLEINLRGIDSEKGGDYYNELM